MVSPRANTGRLYYTQLIIKYLGQCILSWLCLVRILSKSNVLVCLISIAMRKNALRHFCVILIFSYYYFFFNSGQESCFIKSIYICICF